MLKTLARCGMILGALSSATILQAADEEIIAPTRIENVRVQDGRCDAATRSLYNLAFLKKIARSSASASSLRLP